MFATLAALFFAFSLIAACTVIVLAFRQNIDAISNLLRDYTQMGGASVATADISVQIVTKTQPVIAPYIRTFNGQPASSSKPVPIYRKRPKIIFSDYNALNGGSLTPVVQRVAA